MQTVIKTEKITRTYYVGDIPIPALKETDLSINYGEFVAIMGPSGSGKSTLMNILGCLDPATSGNYYLDGKNVRSLSKDEYADIRNQKLGFVFQVFNLLPRTSALENVELPLIYDRTERMRNPKQMAIEALKRVGLEERMHHEPNQLSGGQQQRVAIARALVNEPSLILADEPTGNLDTLTSLDIISLLQELNNQGITVVIVTHEPDIARYAKRVIKMRDGYILQDQFTKEQRNAREDLNNMKSSDAYIHLAEKEL